MKKKFSYKHILYKGKRLAVFCLLILFATGLVVTSNLGKDEVPVHDGDVLVDSLAIDEESSTAELTGTFDERRAKLELDRNKLISTLDSTINNSKNDNEKNNASKEKDRILGYMEQELSIETMIESKNLPDSFVVITESGVCVTVDKQDLDSNTVAKICDIVMRETKLTADKIIIQSSY